ncbi:hypothetical protein AUC43_16050 [Hymenobacter sedentarius]|uniref:Uncharacterized protein n=1 Tax=Hymenobacter sedentarius TaxID=1411621 RepID=A0A0U4C1L1_9BACT|nr:hypothetical protein [Hymenobacter sedentarius]ALW86465.1 hypothetical protein AUC43_16050 [Hymenobacter sedentarius]
MFLIPMNFRLLPLLGLLLTGATAHAQQGSQSGGVAAQANLNALVAGAPAVLPRGESYGLKGSPYADNRWLPALITLNTNTPLAPVPLKYDVLDHRLLMRTLARPKDSLQLDDRQVVRFVLQEPATPFGPARQRVFRRFSDAPLEKHRTDYVEVLHEGQYSLLKHYIKTLKKANYQGAYSTDQRYDEIEDKTVYYLRSAAGSLVPVKLALKPLQAAAPTLAAALKTAVAAKSPKTEADWADVLNTVDPSSAK